MTRIEGAKVGNNRHHTLRITLKFHNLTAQPIILAYKTGSSTVTDNLGNRYYWGRAGTHDVSASGIGIVEWSKADPQFTLQPGESREAAFGLIRYNVGNQEIGSTFSYDAVIDQLELLNGAQLRVVRDYNISYHDLPVGGAAAPVQTSKLVDALRKKLGGKPR